MRTCRKCDETKPLVEFDLRADTGKQRSVCNACRRKRQRRPASPRAVDAVGAGDPQKKCTRCGKIKALAEFPPIRRGGERRQSWCRACFAEVNAAYYARNHEREKARLVAQVTLHRIENRRNIIEYLHAHACVDCRETDIVVLEFDHRGEKVGDVSTYANSGRTWATVLREIEKCDVRCANCHRRETARRTLARKPQVRSQSRKALQLPLEAALSVRTCRVCGVEKALSEFPLRSARTGVRQHICFSCQRVLSASWYAVSVGRAVRRQRPRGGVSRAALGARVFGYLIDHPCVDCGEADPIVLDFDHRADKIANVATLVRDRVPWEMIAAEIAKCDVRCVNCHRRKTVQGVGGYRIGA